ncbi:MAG: murein L,D-transpeptidase catalytic domain family protein [Halioglobus sp.]
MLRIALFVLLTLSGAAMATDVKTLASLAPQLKPAIINEALGAVECARQFGIGNSARYLSVIDYTRSSQLPRLWVFDMKKQTLKYEEYVAHGKGSGEDVPTQFSDREGSHQTSLGLFLTDTTYEGGHGLSLRLHGLNRDLNQNAFDRLIVMHGAPYVNPKLAASLGRLGRSWGCPAVRTEVAQPMIDLLKEGQFIYAYGPGIEQSTDCQYEKIAIPPTLLTAQRTPS